MSPDDVKKYGGMSKWHNNNNDAVDISALKGLTLSEVFAEEGDDVVVFETTCGRVFVMNHMQDCCESVWVESVVGDLSDLIGEPLLVAEEVSDDSPQLGEYDESFTWTFYKLATRKGYVDIRWYGTSNGYYSESVDFFEVTQ